MQLVEDIRNAFIRKRINGDIADNGTIELVGASFIANENSIFGKVNEDYVRRELNWYLSGSLNVNDIEEPIPAIWKAVADNKGFINSNYGWCINSSANGSQYRNVVSTLRKDINSRQAIFIYTRPTMHTDASTNSRRDFMCTNTVQAIVRDKQLNLIVNMRSNDAVFGYKNDLAWHKYVMHTLVRALRESYEIYEGRIYWQTGSLHVYERHFGLIDEAAK